MRSSSDHTWFIDHESNWFVIVGLKLSENRLKRSRINSLTKCAAAIAVGVAAAVFVFVFVFDIQIGLVNK